MSRLIDADKLIEEMSKWYWDKEKQKASEEDVSPMDLFTHLAITTVQEQRTAFDIDKVLNQLEKVRDRYSKLIFAFNDVDEARKYMETECAIKIAIEIVKAGYFE